MPYSILQHRRGTTEEWQNLDLVPYAGELVIEECFDGTCKSKIGNGKTPFSKLPYIADYLNNEILLKISNLNILIEKSKQENSDLFKADIGILTESFNKKLSNNVKAILDKVIDLNEKTLQSAVEFAELNDKTFSETVKNELLSRILPTEKTIDELEKTINEELIPTLELLKTDNKSDLLDLATNTEAKLQEVKTAVEALIEKQEINTANQFEELLKKISELTFYVENTVRAGYLKDLQETQSNLELLKDFVTTKLNETSEAFGQDLQNTKADLNKNFTGLKENFKALEKTLSTEQSEQALALLKLSNQISELDIITSKHLDQILANKLSCEISLKQVQESLNKEIDIRNEAIENIEQKVQVDLQTFTTNTSAELQGFSKNLLALKDEVSKVPQIYDQLQETLGTQINNLQLGIQEAELKIQSSQQHIINLREALESNYSELLNQLSLKSDKQETAESIDQLTTELSKLTSKVSKAEKDSTENLKTLQEDLESLKENVTNDFYIISNNEDTLKSNISTLTSKVATLESDIDSKIASVRDETLSKIEGLEITTTESKFGLEELSELIKSSNTELNQKIENLNNLYDSRHESYFSELDVLAAKTNDLKTEVQDSINKLATDFESLFNSNADIAISLSDIEETLGLVDEQGNLHSATLTKYQTQINDLQTNVSNLDLQYERLSKIDENEEAIIKLIESIYIIKTALEANGILIDINLDTDNDTDNDINNDIDNDMAEGFGSDEVENYY